MVKGVINLNESRRENGESFTTEVTIRHSTEERYSALVSKNFNAREKQENSFTILVAKWRMP